MSGAATYRVLARTYRPQRFEDLIGQDAMVRVLRNAFAHDRIAHAYIFTGVRGVGKTTTARILARALNYATSKDPDAGPTLALDSEGVHCAAIAEGRHPDVLEMDAASRTGVNDIRELIEGVRYRPTQARYKVYIIDEVHMLSTAAFNALLKTLEEPPEHTKFVFATTEIRKVPVTVLSRCQRFDLRRAPQELLAGHVQAIAQKEDVAVDDDAALLIARAAEGSVRDALSLLDQAIAQAANAAVSGADIRAMLGMADRAETLELFDLLMRGDAGGALARFDALYAAGADPAVLLRDLLETSHALTRIKVAPGVRDPATADDRRARLEAIAGALSLGALGRAWQLLLAGHQETQAAPDGRVAAEMALIRLACAAPLPDPAELARIAFDQPETSPVAPAPAPDAGSAPEPSARRRAPPLTDIDGLAALIRAHRDVRLFEDVRRTLRLVRIGSGRLEFAPTDDAPRDLAGRLKSRLEQWTGAPWTITVVAGDATSAATLAEREHAEVEALRAQALGHPIVRAALDAFDGAELEIGPPRAQENDHREKGEAQ